MLPLSSAASLGTRRHEPLETGPPWCHDETPRPLVTDLPRFGQRNPLGGGPRIIADSTLQCSLRYYAIGTTAWPSRNGRRMRRTEARAGGASRRRNEL